MDRPPAFQFYARDWIASSAVTRMTPEQRGFYIQLLAYCWLDGSLPTDERDLSRMAGCSPARWRARGGLVREQFEERDGRLYQRRLEREREKQNEHLRGASEHGKKGARARWGRAAEQCPSNARAMPGDGSSSASASASASACTDTPPDKVVQRGPTLFSMAEHRSHALCGRVCLPAFLYREFGRLKGGSEEAALDEVRVWARGVLAEWAPDGPRANESIGDDPIKFWRLRFREWQPTTASPGSGGAPKLSDEAILADIEAQKALRRGTR